jgi:hypothetical protein
MLYDKWWKNDPINTQMTDSGVSGGQLGGEEQKCKKRRSSADNMANALGVVNIGGIFVVLLCGLAFAITIAIVEFCWKTSSINTSSGGDNKIMQTSPNGRYSRRKSANLKVRTRKSLCAEIAGTLVPYFNYSGKRTSCVDNKHLPKKGEGNVRDSNNSQNQTIECNLYDIQQSTDNEFQALDDGVTPDPLVVPNKPPRSIASKKQKNTLNKNWANGKSKEGLVCENTYDNVPNNCHLHDAPSDEEDYFYRPSTKNKYQDQFTSTRKLKRTLNHSLPSIPPVVPPHAKEGMIEERASTSHRVYVPSLNRYENIHSVL